MALDFTSFVQRAECNEDAVPYDYQCRLAEEGLPELLSVPTGTGKTLASVLPWLYRKRLHPEAAVRDATPRKLILVLPQRSLVNQTHGVVDRWLNNLHDQLGWAPVALHQLMGGESSDDRAWKVDPAADAVFVGTQDMVLSRLLMRGYGEGRTAWPMSFGLLHTDAQFVFDEVQLMGPGLGTSIQLEGLRRKLGSALPSTTMWMSATLRSDRMAGLPDYPDLLSSARRVELSPADRKGPLKKRLEATRHVRELVLTATEAKKYPEALAGHVLRHQVRATRTIVLLNTVERARQVHAELQRRIGELPHQEQPGLVLVHSRFRPLDRAQKTAELLQDPGEQGTVVVATQVLEAGVDVTSQTLITEAAPWSSVVQRAGRCNRAGDDDGAALWWVTPPGRAGHHPYEEADLKASAEFLRSHEDQHLTSTQLQEAQVDEHLPLYSVLRRQDLIDLFDTSPDLDGNDIDVSRWVRDADERTVGVAWRDLEAQPLSNDERAMHRNEICQVPVGQLRSLLAGLRKAGRIKGVSAWVRDQAIGEWRRATDDQIRPGATLVLDTRYGGYTAETGWDAASLILVPLVPTTPPTPPERTCSERVTLAQHGADVRRKADALRTIYESGADLSPDHWAAVVLAGEKHDIGKAHDAFQAALGEHLPEEADRTLLWAKSGNRARLRFRDGRAGLRHELVGALMLHDTGPESDLVAYLVAAHHGQVRLGINPIARQSVHHGDQVPQIAPDGRAHDPVEISTSALKIGGDSWTQRSCRLRDRPDLGPFRLAFLEALVRAADWQASQEYDKPEAGGE
ncbi:CRISPR-associated helicase Cas3' [Kineosporia sp. NBRC 101731]|uniref:type I-G CRISPR-associated helicase/endonuclease Cas3g n=1 Tax=Kineosporia sp. NBRC 101731 TaxID=3032199 RepID=UPI00249FC7AA|nr:CRISPR-associated helicase Cas3' [Kineosporia sp. NBRC 101731]GLY28099.1 hypothetical protein Kisp02_14640 [Kineosporia sp. NBRC 101731]